MPSLLSLLWLIWRAQFNRGCICKARIILATLLLYLYIMTTCMEFYMKHWFYISQVSYFAFVSFVHLQLIPGQDCHSCTKTHWLEVLTKFKGQIGHILQVWKLKIHNNSAKDVECVSFTIGLPSSGNDQLTRWFKGAWLLFFHLFFIIMAFSFSMMQKQIYSPMCTRNNGFKNEPLTAIFL